MSLKTVDIILILIAVQLVFRIVQQIIKKNSFSESIKYGERILLKLKNYRSFSVAGLIYAFLLLGTLYMGNNYPLINFLDVILAVIVAFYQPVNFVSISDAGIELRDTRLKWEKILDIKVDQYSYIINLGKINYYIDHSDIPDADKFKEEFKSSISRFSRKDELVAGI